MGTIAVFLDISKANASTWHTEQLYKLIPMQVVGELVKVIDSFLAHRSFRIKMERAITGWKPMLAEVPQGSTLSPILYNLYIGHIKV